MNNRTIDFLKFKKTIEDTSLIEYRGKVSQIVGLTIESNGPAMDIGQLCKIINRKGENILAEVVGFKDNKILLMPFYDMSGIGPDSKVVALGKSLTVKVNENIVGRVLNGLGQPMDGKEPILSGENIPIYGSPPSPLQRNRIHDNITLGVKAIDGLLTIGKGQRVGIFSGSGVGKSTLIGMIARNTNADVNVIALIGERGREVKEFIEKDLKEEGLKRSVLVIATSDQPALIRLKGAYVATAIAEYFRSQGKDVLLLMDSLTRFAMAQREVGLATGEPPVSRGYTPSVFSVMPKLLERAGTSDKGSITGLYSVLVDGDDLTEPVTDTARGILDGHIVLSRNLANRGHYPAIDVLASISRVMPDVTTREQQDIARKIKRVLAIYKDSEDLINIGAYVKGSNQDIDYAIDVINNINEYLMQRTDERYSFEETLGILEDVLK